MRNINTPNDRTYSISQLADEFDVTTRSIRHYEQKKLISPARQGTQRVYSRGDRIRLQLILRGRRIGFSLDEIGEIISMYTSPADEQKQTLLLIDKIQQRRLSLAEQQQDIKTMLQELDHLEQKLKQGTAT